MIDIDGSVLEGGGQILRTALSLSSVLKKSINIYNIRKNRPKGGLAAQHLKGVQLLKEFCNAKVQGDEIGSTSLKFTPLTCKGGKYSINIKTAGSISLILQVILPVALFSERPTHLLIKGGTNVEMAPQVDFMQEIFQPNLEKFGAKFNLCVHKRGYFPRGGGECEVIIEPMEKLNPISLLKFGNVEKIIGKSFVSGRLPISMAYEMQEKAELSFKRFSKDLQVEIKSYKEPVNIATDNCSGIILACTTTTNCVFGDSGLGNRNNRPSEVGATAALGVIDCIQRETCVDKYVQDMLIIYMALASGISRIKTVHLTSHTLTAIHIVEIISGVNFKIENYEEYSIIECAGIGLINSNYNPKHFLENTLKFIDI